MSSASSNLSDLLQRIVAGSASKAEAEDLQSQVLDGAVLLTSAERSVTAGRDISRSVILVGENQIQLRLDECNLSALRGKLFPNPLGLPPPAPTLLFMGREAAMMELREHLRKAHGRPCIVVTGWPGVGKTTLMSAIGRDRRVLKQFPDGVLWTSLGQNPSIMSSLASWGTALGTDAILRTPTVSTASQQLASLLGSKKMLLLVDDVWNPEDLWPFLAARGPDCVVLVTTREPRVPQSLTATPAIIQNLPVLQEQAALGLFRAIAPEIAAVYPVQTRELVTALECLPLAIHVAARLLSTEAKFGWGIRELITEMGTGKAVLGARPPV